MSSLSLVASIAGYTSIACSTMGIALAIRRSDTCWLLFAAANLLALIADITGWYWYFIPVNAILFVYCLWQWWKRRKDKRKRAMALTGAKSRALRDALVRKMRQLRIPGVPLPQPA